MGDRTSDDWRLLGRLNDKNKGLKRQLDAASRRQTQHDFENKQSGAQYRKLERDYGALKKENDGVKMCGACTCLAGTRRSNSTVRPQLKSILRTRSSSIPRQENTAPPVAMYDAPVIFRIIFSANHHTIDQLLREIATLRDQTEALKGENARISARGDDRDLLVELTGLRENNDVLNAEIEGLRRSNGGSTTNGDDAKRLRRERDNLSTQLAHVRTERDSARREGQTGLADVQRRLKCITDNQSGNESTIDRLRKEARSRETNLLRCEQQLKELNGQRNRVQTKSDQRDEELISLRAETAVLKSTVDKLTTSSNTVPPPVSSSTVGGGGGQLRRTASAPRCVSTTTRGPNHVNPYCTTCRELREELRVMTWTRTSPDSGLCHPSPDNHNHSTAFNVDEGHKERVELQSQLSKTNTRLQMALIDVQSKQREVDDALALCSKAHDENVQLRQTHDRSSERRLRDGERTAAQSKYDALVDEMTRLQERLTHDAQSWAAERDDLRKQLNHAAASTSPITIQGCAEPCNRQADAPCACYTNCMVETSELIETTHMACREKEREMDDVLLVRDCEIGQLKASLDKLTTDYNHIRSLVRTQDEAIRSIQKSGDEILTSSSATPPDVVRALQTEVQQLRLQIDRLSSELSTSTIEQEELRARALRYMNEIKTYEKLMEEKEHDRAKLRDNLEAHGLRLEEDRVSVVSRNSDESSQVRRDRHDIDHAINNANEHYLDDLHTLRAQVVATDVAMEALQSDLVEEQKRTKALHDTLVSQRQIMLQKDAEVMRMRAEINDR